MLMRPALTMGPDRSRGATPRPWWHGNCSKLGKFFGRGQLRRV